MSRYLKSLHKPCDKLDKYDNEPYMKNPLLKLTLEDIRAHRKQNRIEDNALMVCIFKQNKKKLNK
jgi:dynein heavy chain, axonemal